MKIGKIFSYKKGEYILKTKYKKEYREIKKLLQKSSNIILFHNKNMGKRANSNRHNQLVKIFEKNGWKKGNFNGWFIDAFKKIPVEFETSFLGTTIGTIVKLNTLFNEQKIGVGVIIVYDENTPKVKAKQGGQVPTIKRINNSILKKCGILFNCPLVLISIICNDDYENKYKGK